MLIKIYLRGFILEFLMMGECLIINFYDSYWYIVFCMWIFFGVNIVFIMLSYIIIFIYWYIKEEGIKKFR